MHGYLVVNSFIDTPKFLNLYQMLVKAFDKRNVSLEVKTSIDLGLELDVIKDSALPDFVIFWDKDIYLGNKLEGLGIRLFNTPKSVLLCDDKILMYQELKKHGIRIPRTYVAHKTYLPLNEEHSILSTHPPLLLHATALTTPG